MEQHCFRWGTAQQALAAYFSFDGKTISDVSGASLHQ